MVAGGGIAMTGTGSAMEYHEVLNAASAFCHYR
jgi:hypothetical protein